jgi:ferrochelatase
MTRRVAIVLFNLGGPDQASSVRPFLVNLFTDPAILRVPGFIRPWLGKLIAWRRTAPALENYMVLGGKSPLLELTLEQADALQQALAADPDAEYRSFVAMRYWHPMSEETAREVQAWAPDEVLLLPLYPQYSTTTTGSSVIAWDEACEAIGLDVPTTTLCCFHSHPGFAEATARLVREAYAKARAELPEGVHLRVLFSAHGLPESIIRSGDPYQWQVEQTVAGVIAALDLPELDAITCYQSRVTPQKWIGPSTEDEIERARPREGGDPDLPDRLRVRAFGNPGGARRRVPRGGRQARHSRLFPRAGPQQRPGLHRRPGRAGAPRARLGPQPVLLRRAAAMPEGPGGLPPREAGPASRPCGLTIRPSRPSCSTATACWPTAKAW